MPRIEAVGNSAVADSIIRLKRIYMEHRLEQEERRKQRRIRILCVAAGVGLFLLFFL